VCGKVNVFWGGIKGKKAFEVKKAKAPGGKRNCKVVQKRKGKKFPAWGGKKGCCKEKS